MTQFEALTAAAYHELARARVEVAVIEAGLGGRFDATNVIPSRVQVLTGVGLEHTRWLGPTITDIAAEKLAVVRDHATLVVGELDAESEAVAERVAAEHHASLVRAGHDPGVELRAPGRFQRRNFALAAAAAEAFLGREPDAEAIRGAAAETRIPGRLDVVGERPLTVYDGAHNPGAGAALADALPEVLGGRSPKVGLRAERARGQGRRRHAARAAAAVRPRRVHALRQPARAVAGHARSRSRRSSAARHRRRWRTRAARSSARRRSPARTARWSRPARST